MEQSHIVLSQTFYFIVLRSGKQWNFCLPIHFDIIVKGGVATCFGTESYVFVLVELGLEHIFGTKAMNSCRQIKGPLIPRLAIEDTSLATWGLKRGDESLFSF